MNKNAQSGSAIIWIFIAVGLFAAITVAFSQSSRNSTNIVNDEKAESYANQIIAYGNDVKGAVKRLQLRGCSDTEISFENDVMGGYENPNAPISKKCHVFDIAGGGLRWRNSSSNISGSQWIMAAGNKIRGVGTDDPGTMDFFVGLKNIPTNICIKINDSLNHSLTVNPPQDGGDWSDTKFVGTYAAANVIARTDHGLEGLKSACFADNSLENIFYTVLIEQ